jgi:RNA polymerase I-specific transcription initiation factor RRN6
MSDDHHSHGHDHSHDDHDHSHGGGGHDHSNDLTPALQSTLYSQIDFDKIVTLNEREPGSGTAVVKKTWDERLDPKPELISDADEQILMTVP